ncbi:hypothetical protein CLOP_g11965 [Closterium sp. NIES-67]|nr:hypothetical protein CLOP_g11965 [Closterium sp. NIES-67]
MTGKSLVRLLSADRIVLPVAEEVAMHMDPVRQAINCDRASDAPAGGDGDGDANDKEGNAISGPIVSTGGCSYNTNSSSSSSRRAISGDDLPVIAVDATSQGVAKAIQFCEHQVEVERTVTETTSIEDGNGNGQGTWGGMEEEAGREEWEEHFMAKVDGDGLMEIFKAAKALGIEPLVNLMCRRVQVMVDELAPLEQEKA